MTDQRASANLLPRHAFGNVRPTPSNTSPPASPVRQLLSSVRDLRQHRREAECRPKGPQTVYRMPSALSFQRSKSPV